MKKVLLDVDLCVGCGACVVACMDQNDIYPENGQPALRRMYQVEAEEYKENNSIKYLSVACQHCEDSPCVVSCPTGALHKQKSNGIVAVNRSLCIGCHSCALACPFGVPRYDQEEKLQKCNLCTERVEAGLEPACVRVCPQRALKYEDVNLLLRQIEEALAGNYVRGGTGKG